MSDPKQPIDTTSLYKVGRNDKGEVISATEMLVNVIDLDAYTQGPKDDRIFWTAQECGMLIAQPQESQEPQKPQEPSTAPKPKKSKGQGSDPNDL